MPCCAVTCRDVEFKRASGREMVSGPAQEMKIKNKNASGRRGSQDRTATFLCLFVFQIIALVVQSFHFHSIPFHSIPFQSIPINSIPFHSIPIHSTRLPVSIHPHSFISFSRMTTCKKIKECSSVCSSV